MRDARQTLARMEASDPTLRPLIDQSAGYIVFPSVGSGGFIVGGGGGSGVLFENGQFAHFAEISHMAVGALVGGQTYAQLVVVRDRRALEELKSGRFNFGAQATAVIARAGAASNAQFDKGVAVFIDEKRGAMANASLTGQKIRLTL